MEKVNVKTVLLVNSIINKDRYLKQHANNVNLAHIQMKVQIHVLIVNPELTKAKQVKIIATVVNLELTKAKQVKIIATVVSQEPFPIFMGSQVLVTLAIMGVIKLKQGKLNVYYVVLDITKTNKVKLNVSNVQKEHIKI